MIAELGLVLTVIILMALAGWAARQADRTASHTTRFLVLWALILAGFVTYTAAGFVALYLAPATAPASALPVLDPPRGLATLVLAFAGAIYLWAFVRYQTFRQRLTRWLPAPADPDWDPLTRPWPRQVKGFEPGRWTHAYGLGLGQLLLIQTLSEYLLAGGQAGLLADGLEQGDVIASAGATGLLLVTVSLISLGAFQDRSWRALFERLGLQRPRASELVVGIGLAGALLAFQFCAGLAWMALSSQETFEQQTQLSQAIAGSVTTLYGAFLVALFSSIGEEIAFRGALQPVVGLWATSLLFALTHIQYNFTPAAVIIFVVGLAFGWIRQQYGTAAAITTHFVYNFSLLVLAWLATLISVPPA